MAYLVKICGKCGEKLEEFWTPGDKDQIVEYYHHSNQEECFNYLKNRIEELEKRIDSIQEYITNL